MVENSAMSRYSSWCWLVSQSRCVELRFPLLALPEPMFVGT